MLQLHCVYNSMLFNLHMFKAFGPGCVPEVILKNCQPEMSYILAEGFNMWLKEFCFPDCWKVSPAVHVFKNAGERHVNENYRPVSLLSVSDKIFKELVNNRLVNHLEKFILCFWFSVWFQVVPLNNRSSNNCTSLTC